MQRLKAEEQKLAGLENLAAETERLRVKVEEDLEALRKKQEKLLAEPGGVTVADLHKVQTALEAKEKESHDRAATIGTLKTQTDLVRARLVEIRRDLFREEAVARVAAIVQEFGKLAHDELVRLDKVAKRAEETVLGPTAVLLGEVRSVLDSKDLKLEGMVKRLRDILAWTAQTRQGLELLKEEATR